MVRSLSAETGGNSCFCCSRMPVPASPDDKGQAAEAGSTPEGDLATRLAQARQRNRPTALVDGPTLDRLNVDDGIGTGMRSGVEFGAALLISIGIGIALDRWLHTTPIALPGHAGAGLRRRPAERLARDEGHGVRTNLQDADGKDTGGNG